MATRISYRASVSFENDSTPVLTYRAEIIAANASQAARRAVTEARRENPGARARSIAIVLEEISRGTVPGKRKSSHRLGQLHPVDVAILGGDPSL